MRIALVMILVASPLLAGPAEGVRTFAGPMRFCGERFAIDLTAGERVAVRQGPDFMLEALISPRGGFELYEGFAPQGGTGDVEVEAGLGLPTYRLTKGVSGYIIWTGSKAEPFYTHLWGPAFAGTPKDFPLLRRLQFGAAGRRGCAAPSADR